MYISYSAAQDPFHSVFRISSILQSLPAVEYEVERILIYDFLVCFPWMTAEIGGVQRLGGFTKIRNQLKRTYVRNPYEQIPEPKIMFKRMRPAQFAAINSLASYGLVSPEKLKEDRIVRTTKHLPESLIPKVAGFIAANQILFDFLVSMLNQLPMIGVNGLKAKTGLEEFRYDYIQA